MDKRQLIDCAFYLLSGVYSYEDKETSAYLIKSFQNFFDRHGITETRLLDTFGIFDDEDE